MKPDVCRCTKLITTLLRPVNCRCARHGCQACRWSLLQLCVWRGTARISVLKDTVVAGDVPPLQAVAHASGNGSGWPKSLAARRRVAIRPEPTASSSLGDGCSPAVPAGARSTLPRSARSTVQGGPRRASPATASITRCSRSSASSSRALQLPHSGDTWPTIALALPLKSATARGPAAAHRKVDILATAVTMRPCSAAGTGDSAGALSGALASCDATGASTVAGAGPHACRQVARSPLTVVGTEARRLATHCAAAATCAPAAQLW